MVPQDDANATAVQTLPLFSTEQYRELGSSGDAFTDALVLLRQAGVELTPASELGDGFSVVDKTTLIGVEMLCIEWNEYPGDFGLFTSARCVTKDGRKVIIVDGSSGIHTQMHEYADLNRGLYPRHWLRGLRASDYTFTTDEGVERPARTYYIDTSS